MVVSNDGAVICCADRYHLRRVALHNASGKSTVEVTPQHAGTKWLDLTGDGRLLATGTWRGRNVRVWNAQNGRMLKAIPAKSACVAFDPRGTMLAIDEGRRFSVWRTKDWTSVLAKQRKPNGGFEPDCLAFSPDGRILAVLDACNVIRLLETRRFTELARLELPFAYVVEAITFSPTGDRLVAASRGSWGALHIWDLLKLRNRLFKLKLDWNRLRPPSRAGESKPVHLSIIAD